MPTYRISRLFVTDAIDVDAPDPETAKAIFQKSGVQAKSEFVKTTIDELNVKSASGYHEETTQDLIGEKQ